MDTELAFHITVVIIAWILVSLLYHFLLTFGWPLALLLAAGTVILGSVFVALDE
jgi:hypothetical protein